MKFFRYLSDKMFEIIIVLLFELIMVLMLLAFKLDYFPIIVLSILFSVFMLLNCLWEFYRKRQFYNELFTNLDRLDKKYLIVETLKNPNFYEGELLVSALYDINKSMCERVNDYHASIDSFRDYVEMWIHEVKIPLASMHLMCHNNKDLLDKKLMAQVRRINQYMDHILYYVRSEYAENDYLIKEINLSKIVTQTALNNREDLQENHINFNVGNVKYSVMTDGKWLEFILNQIINNCIKYKSNQRQSSIQIFAEEQQDKIVLHIKDNGIGIVENDLPNVFKKSFTGSNGRKNVKSTGMGLYIVKRLCNKLGHGVQIKSVAEEYTDVMLIFSRNNFYKM